MFVHDVRPQWGVGLWVKEQSSKRRLRFEDGEIRAFKKGYYHHLKLVDPSRDDLDDLFEALADEHELALAEKAKLKARTERPPVMSWEDQVRVFKHLYDDGFQGADYIEAARTRESGRMCKRHVDEEVQMTSKLMAKEAMQLHMAKEDYSAIVDDMITILKRTTLVKPAKGHKILSTLDDAEDRKTLALGVYRLLHGKKRFRKRFKAWVKALHSVLGKAPQWGLATVFPALMYPEKHIAVKRRALSLQARELKPGLHVRRKVNRRSYRKARRVTRLTEKKLREAGLQPRDLLDVRQFMWDTLRPKGQKVLAELNGETE